MTPATECHPLPACRAPSPWSRRLLSRLSGLFRPRSSSFINPEELPPHLLRDLGLANHGSGSDWNDPRIG